MAKEKIGVGIITCNRETFLKSCFDSIPLEHVDHIVIVNDGDEWFGEDLKRHFTSNRAVVIQHMNNQGVGKTKNDAFKELLEMGCDHIFLIEDDIIVKNPMVFNRYIEASKETGIQHFMFGYHGPANKRGISHGPPTPRARIEYPNDLVIALNEHCVGAFCYYSRKSLEDVGLFDLNYTNAFEHVDHSYMLAKKGYSTPYWWWADLANSYELLDEIACSEHSSTIRPRKDWQENIQKGAQIFLKKHGVLPAWQNCVPDASLDQVKQKLKDIYKTK